MSVKTLPSQAELNFILQYDENTGSFIWRNKVAKSNRISIGDNAGCVNDDGYIIIKICSIRYAAHRLAWKYHYGIDPINFIDHINGNRKDNRISNLREASQFENARNRKKNSNNKSGFKGVYFIVSSSQWRAIATFNGKSVHIGCFNTAQEASNAYNQFSKLNHKDFYNEVF